jgi:hypothetical protein
MFRSPRRQAVADQVLAVLASTGGFPVSTGQVCHRLGDRLVHLPRPPATPLPPRPACWPPDLVDPNERTQGRCVRCECWHRSPIWRAWTADDIRPMLTRMAAAEVVERIVADGGRAHYWRHTTAAVELADPWEDNR